MPVNSQTMPVNLADAAAETGKFKTFLAAAAKAEIIEMLKTGGPFTLFAPTDEAFSKFPTNTISKLMQLENRALLRSILTYHFAIGKVMSPRFAGKRYRAKTVEGSELRIDGAMAEGAVRVNGARIVWPDIAASNGVLHGIGGVLRPRPVAKKHEGSDRAQFRDQVGLSS